MSWTCSALLRGRTIHQSPHMHVCHMVLSAFPRPPAAGQNDCKQEITRHARRRAHAQLHGENQHPVRPRTTGMRERGTARSHGHRGAAAQSAEPRRSSRLPRGFEAAVLRNALVTLFEKGSARAVLRRGRALHTARQESRNANTESRAASRAP